MSEYMHFRYYTITPATAMFKVFRFHIAEEIELSIGGRLLVILHHDAVIHNFLVSTVGLFGRCLAVEARSVHQMQSCCSQRHVLPVRSVITLLWLTLPYQLPVGDGTSKTSNLN
ncbi:hypothetical protein R1flu_014003 [Riccia fluitans]|uniref:Uncharacterized protein n=1 Tax=Riccia fluitans TaxID=41844 RepID=A0ABD1YIL1_9MARC